MSQPIYHRPQDYDLEHAKPEPDVDFYLRLLERWRPRRVLELGCGSGRVTIPLARRAAEWKGGVTGLEIVPEMLEAARKKSESLSKEARAGLRWIQGDMRSWQADEPFDLIISPCGTLCHLLALEDQLAAWRQAHTNLNPGGRFIADVTMANLPILAESLATPPRALLEVDSDTSRQDAGGKRRLLRYKTTRYHAADQRASVRFLYDEFADDTVRERFLSDYESHVYFPRELELLFRVTGFRVESAWGDYQENPLGNASRALIIAGVKE